jgi:death on curing protein
MKLLTLEQLLQIHTLAVDATGGSVGLRDIGRLESAIATQTQHVFGDELYSSTIEKSAALIRAIIADHPFVDGNKRTALLAGLALLDMNGVAFAAQLGEIEDFAVKVATDKLDIPAVARWLRKHVQD